MKIHCLTTFLDGTERFESGDTRTVDDERGARLVAAGWAEDMSGATMTGEETAGTSTLKINSGKSATGDNHG
jgi:hypothetical protein